MLSTEFVTFLDQQIEKIEIPGFCSMLQWYLTIEIGLVHQTATLEPNTENDN